MATTDFPSPLSDDVEDVVLALELGGSLWAKGDVRESVRWLRRAAAAAEAAGNDIRGVRLAAMAADIVTEFAITSMTPPPPSVARRSSGPPPLPPAASHPLPETTPPPIRVSTRPPPLPISHPSPPPPPVKVSTRPPPLPVSPQPSPTPPPVDQVADHAVDHGSDRTESSSALPRTSLSSLPPPVSHTDDGSTGTRRGRAGALRSYRVYLEQSPEGGLKVHALRDGDRAPAGTREAILVVAEPSGSRNQPKAD
jgi:hypothetical protein